MFFVKDSTELIKSTSKGNPIIDRVTFFNRTYFKTIRKLFPFGRIIIRIFLAEHSLHDRGTRGHKWMLFVNVSVRPHWHTKNLHAMSTFHWWWVITRLFNTKFQCIFAVMRNASRWSVQNLFPKKTCRKLFWLTSKKKHWLMVKR